MMSNGLTLFLYALLPTLLIIIGSIFTLFKKPSAKLSSTVQHFAAGIVIAVVAVELIPMITKTSNQWLVVVGFAAGVITMLAVDSFAHRAEKKALGQKFPFAMILAIGTDLFIDGILIGVTFLASQRSGLVVASAMALETLFLGLSISVQMFKNNIRLSTQFITIISLALIIPAGALIGYFVLSEVEQTFRTLVLPWL